MGPDPNRVQLPWGIRVPSIARGTKADGLRAARQTSIAVVFVLVCSVTAQVPSPLSLPISRFATDFWPDFRLTNMLLYYVELEWDGREQGEALWFPDLDSAEREAKEVAAEIIRQLGLRSINLSIRDQHKVIQKEIVVSN